MLLGEWFPFKLSQPKKHVCWASEVLRSFVHPVEREEGNPQGLDLTLAELPKLSFWWGATATASGGQFLTFQFSMLFAGDRPLAQKRCGASRGLGLLVFGTIAQRIC